MRLERLRLEFRMELAPNEVRMIRQFHHLHVSAIGRRSGNAQSRRSHWLFVLAVELITVPVPLTDLERAVNFRRQSIRLDAARPGSQPHRPAKFFHTAQ